MSLLISRDPLARRPKSLLLCPYRKTLAPNDASVSLVNSDDNVIGARLKGSDLRDQQHLDDIGHLNCKTACQQICRQDCGQCPGSSRPSCEGDRQRRRGCGRHGANGPVVKDHSVVGSNRRETKACNCHRCCSDGKAGSADCHYGSYIGHLNSGPTGCSVGSDHGGQTSGGLWFSGERHNQ